MRIAIAMLCFLASLCAKAQGISVKISAEAKIKVYHYGKKSGGIKCGNGDNGVYHNFERNYSNSSEHLFKKDESVATGVRTGMIGESPNLLTIRAKAKIDKDDESETYKLTISEEQISDFGHSWTASCDDNHYSENLKNASYKVNAEFSYVVPDDVWAIDIEESDYDNLFTIKKTLNGDGRLDGMLFETTNQGLRRIWVQPGSTIKKIFVGHNFKAVTANPNDSAHTYWIRFKPVGKKMEVADMDLDWLNTFVKSVSSITSGAIEEDSIGAVVNNGASVLRSRAAFREALQSLPTNQLRNMSEALFQIATKAHYLNNPQLENSIRIIAAFTSYELASVLIEELAPYCEMQTVELPYTLPNGETKSVLGLHYATFLMDRLQRRIQGPLVSFHRSFLDKLKEVSERHDSYGSIFNESGLKFKLRDSYNVMRRVAQPQSRPYAQAVQDLDDFYKVFRSVGTGEANTDNVIQRMRELSDLENAYIHNLFAHIAKYSPGNNEPIDLVPLYNQLDRIQAQTDLVVKVTTENMRFLSLGDEDGFDSFAQLLSQLESHNIAIINKPYKVHEFEFNFEEVRKAFNDAERTLKNIETVNRCQRH